MGIYDREYYQEQAPGMHLGGNYSMVTNLVIVNAVIYLVDMFMKGGLTETLALQSDLIQQPWRCWDCHT